MGGEVVVLLVNTTALVMAINSMVHVVPIVVRSDNAMRTDGT